MKYSIFALLLVCSLGIFTPTLAQIPATTQTDINVDMNPPSPGPNEVVTVALTSFSTDINAANITWRVNGTVQKTGVGQKLFTFTTGSINTKTTLNISISTFEGEAISKTLVIQPVSIDLIWQSYGFVPPFYKGKSIFSHQNRVSFIALPHMMSGNGTEISVKNLIYKWTNNGTVDDTASGFGKNAYTFVSPLISRPIDIEVEVTSPSTSETASAEMILNPQNPIIIFYAKNPIYGIEFQKALHDNVVLGSEKELSVIGEPYFFGVANSSNPDLTYKWSINGLAINNGSNSATQVFRQIEGTTGSSNISLSVDSARKILQSASNSFSLVFGPAN